MLKIENLIKKYGENEVLKGINETIKKGERIVIIGPSGSGKSTFLRCLNYLEKPTSGKITFEGKVINEKNIVGVRKKIGMVFQSFNLLKNLTIIENITIAPIKTNLLSKEEAIKKGIDLLKRIGLEDKKDNYPSDLSGGEQQRIAIIRSLMMNPDIILFDEPTSALDPQTIDEVLNLMKEVANNGMTMIVVTHEINFAKNFATRILFMSDGQIVERGDPLTVLVKPKTEKLKEFLSKTRL